MSERGAARAALLGIEGAEELAETCWVFRDSSEARFGEVAPVELTEDEEPAVILDHKGVVSTNDSPSFIERIEKSNLAEYASEAYPERR